MVTSEARGSKLVLGSLKQVFPPSYRAKRLGKITEIADGTAKHFEKSVLYSGNLHLRFFPLISLAASVDRRCNLFLLPRDDLIAMIN
jgi:hypothetical protein